MKWSHLTDSFYLFIYIRIINKCIFIKSIVINESLQSINKLFNEDSIMEGIFKVLKNLASEFAMDIVSYIN